MDPVRFGMIGAGSISNSHLPEILANPGAAFAAIADPNLDLARAQAERYGGAAVCATYQELVERDDVDAVIVGIPTRFHADAAVQAARHGKHALCEKPMARTLAECDAMIAAHAEAGTVLQMGFVCRFDDAWGQLRQLVQAGRAGRPCLWRCVKCGPPPQPPYGTWYTDSRFSDGPLAESASHDIDFLRYTFGEVTAVTASVSHRGPVGDVLDNPLVILDFAGGDQALLHWAWLLPAGARAGFGGLDVVGPLGSLHAPRRDGERWFVDVSGPGGVEAVEFDNRRDSDTWFGGQLNDFLAAIRGERTPRATGEDGRKAHEVFEAAVRSSAEGRRVILPLAD